MLEILQVARKCLVLGVHTNDFFSGEILGLDHFRKLILFALKLLQVLGCSNIVSGLVNEDLHELTSKSKFRFLLRYRINEVLLPRLKTLHNIVKLLSVALQESIISLQFLNWRLGMKCTKNDTNDETQKHAPLLTLLSRIQFVSDEVVLSAVQDLP